MGKKSEARALRKAQAQEKFEANKASFIAKVNADQLPRTSEEPSNNDSPRLAPHLAREAEKAELQPKAIKDGSRFASRVTWCCTKADLKDSWSWGEPRAWEQKEWEDIIYPPFKEFALLTWQEIDNHSSDSGHKKHHSHEVSDLRPEAQERWKQLDFEQYDTVFRFRIGNVERVWGFILQAHFHIIWWDRRHSIYPTEPN